MYHPQGFQNEIACLQNSYQLLQNYYNAYNWGIPLPLYEQHRNELQVLHQNAIQLSQGPTMQLHNEMQRPPQLHGNNIQQDYSGACTNFRNAHENQLHPRSMWSIPTSGAPPVNVVSVERNTFCDSVKEHGSFPTHFNSHSNRACSSVPSTSSLEHDHRYEKKKTANKDNSKPRNASNRICSSGSITSSSDQDHIYAKKRTANKDNSKPKKSRVVDRDYRKTFTQDWKSPREKLMELPTLNPGETGCQVLDPLSYIQSAPQQKLPNKVRFFSFLSTGYNGIRLYVLYPVNILD
ncbi:hypothetical protein CDAR_317591 [Caerostris darwini]|uniref:Uncharacterized protein n=1 Tax=Caerostris darwini TaxID=1538125 RepID=A0AAV4SKR3_9ARAC|nr:hypothetical protein CDAR_317591 [Caerostris darwini]